MKYRKTAVGVVVLASLWSLSCGSLVTQGRSASYVILDSLAAASGARPDEFGNTLASDVLTLVKRIVAGQEQRIPTIFADTGRATVRLGLKDVTATGPTTNNEITLTRYRVVYVRSDGRNREGIDVPYAVDGAITHTVVDDPTTFTFTLVRAQAKEEPPLIALRNGGGAINISTIAEVTFWGRDQTGREVVITGRISVNFADWGDPE